VSNHDELRLPNFLNQNNHDELRPPVNNHNNHNNESSMSSVSCRQRGSSRRFFSTLCLALSLLLVPHGTVFPVHAAGFDEQECLRCVGTGTLSDNPSQSTYCVIDNVNKEEQAQEEGLNFQCVTEDDIALCEKGSGSAFYVGQECIDEEAVAVAMAILILLCCCGLGVLGTIAACLAYCCCCAGSSRRPSEAHHGRVVVVDGSDNDCGTSLEMATTTARPPTYAALPTQQSSSIAALPYAQAVVASSNDDHAVMGSSAKFC
jgi:hypothetical protein